MELYCYDVNSAFRQLTTLFAQLKIGPARSRLGTVKQYHGPVTLVYTNPLSRVLANPARDANPFFHLYESLWMLAGRNDAAPPAYYNKKMAEFSDDGATLNGAYGYRWRSAASEQGMEYEHSTDQLDILVAHLKQSPNSRRAVLQMWNVNDDLLRVDTSKDVCCNTEVMFTLRGAWVPPFDAGSSEERAVMVKPYLDMTVINRSNDMVLGLLGSDYVTFSILQEYMAARVGAAAGTYYHFTNNLHVYESNFKPGEWLAAEPDSTTKWEPPVTVPLVADSETFDRELLEVVESNYRGEVQARLWEEPFFNTVAQPMFNAFACHRTLKDPSKADGWARCIGDDDWKSACLGWLGRRNKKEVV